MNGAGVFDYVIAGAGAAGSIGSPQILQLSGMGPGALLAEHGAQVIRDDRRSG